MLSTRKSSELLMRSIHSIEIVDIITTDVFNPLDISLYLSLWTMLPSAGQSRYLWRLQIWSEITMPHGYHKNTMNTDITLGFDLKIIPDYNNRCLWLSSSFFPLARLINWWMFTSEQSLILKLTWFIHAAFLNSPENILFYTNWHYIY